ANRPSSVTAAAATVARPPRPTPAKRGVPSRTRAFATTSASGAYSVSAARSPFASNSTACRAISCTMSGVPTAAVAPLGARRRERVTQAAPSVAASSSTRRALARIERAQHRPGEQRDQDLVVAGELNPATAGERRALDDVYPRPVVALHVAVADRETGRLAAAQVARHGEGLEEHLGHHQRAAEIEDDAAVVEGRERRGESLEVTVARGAERGAVRRGVLMGDHAAVDQLAVQRSQADLDDVPAEHGHDTTPARGARHLPDDRAEVLCGEDVGERIPEGGEARIAAGGMREQRGVDFVGALRDGDRLHPGQVRLAVVGHGCSGRESAFSLGEAISLSLSVTWPNENFDCSASMMCRLSSDSHIRASAFSAKMPPPFGMRGRTTIASHFFPATPTRSRFKTST